MSGEAARYLYRADLLGQVGDEHTIRMISFEPVLDDMGGTEAIADALHRNRIGWAISGGEGGWSARPAKAKWFKGIRDAAVGSGEPYFHKQHGGRGVTEAAKLGGHRATLDGLLWKQIPAVKQLSLL